MTIKKIISVALAVFFCVAFSINVMAEDNGRLYDGANLLTESEEKSLLEKLDSVSEKYKVDFIIVTVESLDGDSADNFVKDYYDENDCGYGENSDGVLLLVSMEERDYRILSNGLGAKAITADEIETIGNAVSSYLSLENYVSAFNEFVEKCEYEINGEINGFPFDFAKSLIISLVIGLVVAFIVTGSMKGKLKSVKMQTFATEYTKQGSLKVTNSSEFFLYRTIDRRKKEKESSSNSSRNVGGGKF